MTRARIAALWIFFAATVMPTPSLFAQSVEKPLHALETDVAVFKRPAFKLAPMWRIEFRPYRAIDLIEGLGWTKVRETLDPVIDMAIPPEVAEDALAFDAEASVHSPVGEFPPYRVRNVQRGLAWDEMFEIFGAAVEAPRDPRAFSFVLSEESENRWQVACRWTPTPGQWSLAGESAGPNDARGVMSIECRFDSAAGEEPWTLIVDTSLLAKMDDSVPSGRLSSGRDVFTVSPSYDARASFGGYAPLAGYVFAKGETAVAAVTAEGARNRLTVRRSVSPRDRSLLAAAAQSLSLLPSLAADHVDDPSETPGFSFTLTYDSRTVARTVCASETYPSPVEPDAPMLRGSGLVRFTLNCALVAGDQPLHTTFEIAVWIHGVPSTPVLAGRIANARTNYEVMLFDGGRSWGGPIVGYLFTLVQKPVAVATTDVMGELRVHNSVAPEDRVLIAAAAHALVVMTPLGVR